MVSGQRTGIYAAAKAGVRSFARSWANELKDRKIRVNSISPGAIGDTSAFAAIPKEATDFFVSLVPLGRFGLSKETAAAVLYLTSDDSRFTTAIDLVAHGGMSQV